MACAGGHHWNSHGQVCLGATADLLLGLLLSIIKHPSVCRCYSEIIMQESLRVYSAQIAVDKSGCLVV